LANVKKITELFLDLEKDKNLFDIKIDDNYVWNYLRNEILSDLYDSLLKYKINNGNNFKALGFKLFFRKFSDLFKLYILPILNFKPHSFNKYDILIFNYSHYQKMGDGYVNQHSYPISNILRKNYKVAVCDRDNYAYKLNSYNCPIVDIRPIYLRARLFSKIKKNNSDVKKFVNDIYEYIFSTFNYKIDKKKYLYEINFRILNNKIWKNIFSKNNIKLIIYCNNGNMDEVISAAKTNHVITTELQHSIISELNIFYNYKSKSKNICINDYLLTWGDYWNKIVNSKVKRITIGSVSKYKIYNEEHPLFKDSYKNILIVGNIKSRNQLYSLAVDLAKKLPDYTIYYKLRPEEYFSWKNIFPNNHYLVKNLIIIDDFKFPLEFYLKLCDYIIGIDSTVLLEGILNGKTPIYLKDKFCWYMSFKTFYENSIGYTINNADDFIKRQQLNPGKNININLSNFLSDFETDTFLKFVKKVFFDKRA